MEHSKPNGVPRWVEDRFDRLSEESERLENRISKLEERSVDMRVWQGKVVVWGVIGMALLNGFVTLCIMLIVRRFSSG